MSNAYEIRWNILEAAKSMLYEQWYKRCEIQERNCKKNGSTEFELTPPAVEQIKQLANELYEFVQQKSS